MVAVSLKKFFFSSRRRHTRSLCDWSSDVCSSDLAVQELHLLQQLSFCAAETIKAPCGAFNYQNRAYGSVSEELKSGLHDVLDSEAEYLEELVRGSRLAEGVHADNLSVKTDVLVPVVADAGLDGNAAAY